MNTYKCAKTSVNTNHDGYMTKEHTFVIHCEKPEYNSYYVHIQGFSDCGQYICCCDVWYEHPDFGAEYVTEFSCVNTNGFASAIKELVLDCIEWAMDYSQDFKYRRMDFVNDLENMVFKHVCC